MLFLFSFLRHVCAAESKAVSQNWCVSERKLTPAECWETKQNANQSVCTVCARAAKSKKRLALISPERVFAALRESDACELKQEIAGNVPGMHALYAAKNKKKMLAGTDSFPLTAWHLRLLCSGGFLWHSFFVWLALIHKYSAPLAFLRGECMRCGRIFALNWKLRLCWENSDESMRIRRLI